MKQLLTSLTNRAATRLAQAIAQQRVPRQDDPDRALQIMLTLQYQERAKAGLLAHRFSDIEFSRYSQNGEDGILLYIFALIGYTNKHVVEMCAGDGIECNAANLIINHGWKGLLFDGNEQAIQRGKAFYAQQTNAWRLRRLPPQLVQAWITAENVNDLIAKNGFGGEIDLFSLDMDGVDYWIWKALTCIQPRVVVVEYNNRWSAGQSVTVPYQHDFAAKGASVDGAGYFGASLLAFKRLAQQKGYRLIGANGPNTNAFFMRQDVGQAFFPEVTVASCLDSDYAHYQQQTKYPLIQNKPTVTVE
ncbi:MAG: hypothetical protein AAF614_37615 [Chloroflexota bacterium]